MLLFDTLMQKDFFGKRACIFEPHYNILTHISLAFYCIRHQSGSALFAHRIYFYDLNVIVNYFTKSKIYETDTSY